MPEAVMGLKLTHAAEPPALAEGHPSASRSSEPFLRTPPVRFYLPRLEAHRLTSSTCACDLLPPRAPESAAP